MVEKSRKRILLLAAGIILFAALVLHFVPVSSHEDPACGQGKDYRTILGGQDEFDKWAKISMDGISSEESIQYGGLCVEGVDRPNKLFIL